MVDFTLISLIVDQLQNNGVAAACLGRKPR